MARCWHEPFNQPADMAPACVQGKLAEFVDFIRERKTVALDDLAAEFGLRTQVSSSLLLLNDLVAAELHARMARR